jgi:ribosome-associated protein
MADDDPGDRLTTPVPDARQRAVVAARAADDKQGADIVVLDVGDIISITDAFVIVSASNTRQVRTIVDEIEAAVKALGGEPAAGSPRGVEGLDDASWVLMDYGDVIVHVFLAETRSYYDLERLWADAPRIEWDALAEHLGQASSR